MITRFATLSGRLLVATALLLTITACGGGGGGGDGFYNPDSGPTTYFLAPTLLDANGNVTSEVTSASPATLRVTVTKNGKNGAPVADVVVTAVTDAAVISPSTGTALSDSSGVANFQLAAGPTKGAGTVTLSAESPAGTVTATVTFQVGASGLRLGYLDADGQFIENEIGVEPDGVLGSQALAQLSLVIIDENGDLASSAETVAFSSGCIAAGQAVLDPVSPITSGDGKVSTSYRAKGCSGNDQDNRQPRGLNRPGLRYAIHRPTPGQRVYLCQRGAPYDRAEGHRWWREPVRILDSLFPGGGQQ